jgi:hypothetical protein
MEKLLFNYIITKGEDIVIAYNNFVELKKYLKDNHNWFMVEERCEGVISIKVGESSPIEYVKIKKVKNI